jgi:hypothetical protein
MCRPRTRTRSLDHPDWETLWHQMVSACPEIETLGLYPVVLGKGRKY